MNAALICSKSVGEKQHITSCVTLMQEFRSMMKSLRKVGGEYKPSNPNRVNYTSSRVKWENVESAFTGRIQTGVVINLQHKDPVEFLNDAEDLFSRRVRNLLKTQTALKVNAVFAGNLLYLKGMRRSLNSST